MPIRRTSAASARFCAPRNPKLFVTLSHEIVREYREYERTSTTALNAFVGPRVQAYLGRLENHLRDEKFGGKINIMRSNGGVMSVRLAQEQPVSMMESGPVAGIIGAGRLAALLGIERAIGFDMGGTTAKASLITNGIPAIEDGYVIGGEASGQPMQIPVVDIVEIGAGGGSIAWCDPTGGIHVGPKSAGADPGPAAYGKGSTDPVVTDANLVLGRINAERFLNGAMKLDVKASERAIEQKLCGPTRLGVKEAALGIVQIADAAMSLAVRAVSVKKGVDPRETAMIAFGGAGPLHAVAIAREIFIPKVIIPKVPGTFSALGMLMASWRQDFVRTLYGLLGSLDAKQVEAVFAELAEAGKAQVARDGIASEHRRLRLSRRPALCRPGAHHRHSGARSETAVRRFRAAARGVRRRARPALRPGRARRAAGDRQRPPRRHRGATGHAGRALAVGAMDAGAAGRRPVARRHLRRSGQARSHAHRLAAVAARRRRRSKAPP